MSRLLIKLRDAPEDEIRDIRSLLRKHHIAFYETQAGPWGISAPGIWLKSEHHYDRAKALLDSAIRCQERGIVKTGQMFSHEGVF